MRQKRIKASAAAATLLIFFGVLVSASYAHTYSSTGHWRHVAAVSGSTWRVRAYTTKGSSNTSVIDFGHASLTVGSYYYENQCSNQSLNCGDLWTANHYYNGGSPPQGVLSKHCAKFADGHVLGGSPNFGHWCTYDPNFLELDWHQFNL
jgi:hypothetical protein